MQDCCRETLLSLRSASEVAVNLGVSRQTVHALATRRGIGAVVNGARAFTPADVIALRKARRGTLPVQ